VVARRPGSAILVAILALVLGLAAGAPAGRPAPSIVYRLRPDPRLCPSPLCGGYFASEVNRTRTTCADGTARPACHALEIDTSRVLLPAQWAQLQRRLTFDQVLVAGTLTTVPAQNGLPAEDRLVASTVWRSTTTAPSAKPIWLVVDTGVRCVANPCFSLRATLVNSSRTAKLSALRGWNRAIPRRGLLAAGTIVGVPNAGPVGTGRELAASRVWLPVIPAG